MARLNIDYRKTRNDSRFMILTKITGDEDRAWGMLLRFWDVAQEHWVKGELVPTVSFDLLGLEKLVDAGLAERRPEGVYARGSEKQFAWLVQKVKAASAGGRAKASSRKRAGTAGECRTSAGAVPCNPAVGVPAACPPLLSISSSLLLPIGSGGVPTTGPSPAPPIPLERKSKRREPAPSTEVWMAYREAYFGRYGSEPVRNARTNANCGQLVQRLGLERAKLIAAWFVSHNGRWYVQSSHMIGCAVKDAEALWTQFDTGEKITSTAAAKAEINDANQAVFGRLAKKWESEGRIG